MLLPLVTSYFTGYITLKNKQKSSLKESDQTMFPNSKQWYVFNTACDRKSFLAVMIRKRATLTHHHSHHQYHHSHHQSIHLSNSWESGLRQERERELRHST